MLKSADYLWKKQNVDHNVYDPAWIRTSCLL
jgi:hypothetical protein